MFFVLVAPIKALCSERHEDWSMKFHALSLSCQELTGDTDVDEFWQLQSADVILTTPVRLGVCFVLPNLSFCKSLWITLKIIRNPHF